jgi:hypothetical protein
VHVRECVPLSSHVPENPPQLPKLPHVVVPQLVPSVLREHASLSLLVDPVHVPLTHVNVVTLRTCVPV